MNTGKFVNVLLAVVAVAGVTTVVARPNSVKVITALSNGFVQSLRAALGENINFGG